MYRISRCFPIAILAICVNSCVIDGKLTGLGIVSILALIFLIGSVIVMTVQAAQKKKEKEERRAIWKQKVAEENAKKEREKELQKEIYEKDVAALINEMGEPEKTIVFAENDLKQEIRASSKTKQVYILGKLYDFDSIISCNSTDAYRVVKGKATISSSGTTKTDNGNMLGRAVVGGMLAGEAGAIIGGSTADRKTTSTSVIEHEDDVIRHDYTVWIAIKDIANPMIQIHIGKNASLMNEVIALMNAIVASK